MGLAANPGRKSAPAMKCFLTFSNGAVGNGRYWPVRAGKQSGEKPYKVTHFGIGRERPEPPSCGSTPGHPKSCGTNGHGGCGLRA